MQVGLEVSAGLSHRFTGVQRYILELSFALADLDVEGLRCQPLLRIGDWRKRHLVPQYPWPVKWYWPGPSLALWHCDVLHSLATRLPRTFSTIARVSTLHDLFALTLPDAAAAGGEQRAVRRYAQAACSDRIIAVSRATKADFLKFFDYPEDKIDVVYHGVSSAFLSTRRSPTPVEEDEDKVAFFVAFAGSPRKNLIRIVKALDPLSADTELRVVGPVSDAERDALKQCRLRVRFEGSPNDEEMARLYRESRGLLFPSLQEGFGLPILEAMSCGIPVLTSQRGATAEVAGGHAILVDPESVEDIAGGISRIRSLSDRELNAAASYARTFSWRRAAEQTVSVYQKVARDVYNERAKTNVAKRRRFFREKSKIADG